MRSRLCAFRKKKDGKWEEFGIQESGTEKEAIAKKTPQNIRMQLHRVVGCVPGHLFNVVPRYRLIYILNITPFIHGQSYLQK